MIVQFQTLNVGDSFYHVRDGKVVENRFVKIERGPYHTNNICPECEVTGREWVNAKTLENYFHVHEDELVWIED